MKTEFLAKFDKDLEKIALDSVRTDILATITNVEAAEKPMDIQNISKLKGYKNAYRIRIGSY